MSLPLSGKRVLVTRPRAQAGQLAERLEALGAEPVFFPAIEIAPVEDPSGLDSALRRLSEVDWAVFTSANGVEAVWRRLAVLGLDARAFEGVRVAAVGPVTAAALAERGLQVNFMPKKYVAEAIAEGLGQVAGLRFLLLTAEIAREALAEELTRRGAAVEHVPAYRTLAAEPDELSLAEMKRGVDMITLASASAARSFAQAAARENWPWLSQAVIACIGPVTAQAASECGLAPHVIAEESTAGGLAAALAGYFTQMKENG